MKHPERVEDYLEHIAEAIQRATLCLRDTVDFAVFEQDQRSQDAVVHNIEIIGEAVTKVNSVAPDFIAQHPEIPWARMRAVCNVMIRKFFSWICASSGAPSKMGIIILHIPQHKG